MTERLNLLAAGRPARVNLKVYAAELPLAELVVGVDNIHHDVYLSPQWCEHTRTYLLELIRQTANLTYAVQKDSRPPRGPETGAWKRELLEFLQTSLTRAKYEKKIEKDILLRVALIKFLTQEIGTQFSNLLLEAKDWIRNRGEYFERSEQAHVMKARLAELQADRRNIFRQVGQGIYQTLTELEENHLARARRALFGDEQSAAYELLANPIAFVEGGRDDYLFLEQYVLLGNYLRDQDRFETFDALLLDFLREAVQAGTSGDEMSVAWRTHQELVDTALGTRGELARLEDERGTLLRRLGRGGGLLARVGFGADTAQLRAALSDAEQRMKHLQSKLEALGPRIEAAKTKADFYTQDYQNRLGDYLNEPENARLLFDPSWGERDPQAAEMRAGLLEEWVTRLEHRDLLLHVLASYELRNLYHDYCPPIHLQQLKKALVSREEFERVVEILKQFPARRYSLDRIEGLAKKLRRYPREEAHAVALRFAEDFMRLRRDLRNQERLLAATERLHLVRSEHTRELSRLNNSLYEFLLPAELRPAQDNVVSHAVVKADVRGSTRITRDLLARGLNPATLFSLHFYEPVKRILDTYGAAKVFIEGDAMVLAIFETESNRTHQRSISKACALARQILAISAAYNERPDLSELPRLELGVGIAFQGSAPTYWVDSDSRIMISRALNLSDRLSSCSRVARRLLGDKASLFRLFIFQPVMQGDEEEEEEFLIRFNLNGIQLNEEGFAKLEEEISLHEVQTQCEMPWGREETTFFYGEAPIGDRLEPILLRRGYVRQMLPDGQIGAAGHRPYYEVCTQPKVFQIVEGLLTAASTKH
jgi:hypothetical protein